MEKQTIVAKAKRLTEATEEAQQWVKKNTQRVHSCGKSTDAVLADLRRQARLFRKLGRAAERKMCAGVFGPSQAGKSYLLSSLARDSSNDVYCDFVNQQHYFLKELNPGGNRESTGLVTRFTMTPPLGLTEEYPVHVRLLSETELVKIFANTYFCDCDHKEKVDKESIRSAVLSLKGRAHSSNPHITLDVMEDLREYISNSFGGLARAAALEDVYWSDALELAPRLPIDERVKLYGIIWDSIPEFNDMFLALVSELEKLNHPDEAFCEMKALLPREASIIDVETLSKTDFSKEHVEESIRMRSEDGTIASISRKYASAIIAELTLVMKHKPADYFDHTDLLDFPGYKARLECTDIRDYLHKGKEDSAVEQFFRRGKVAYLFQRYNAERELTSLLLCVADPNNTPGLPGAVEEWIIATHGKTPEERMNVKNALFYIMTKSDRHFEQKAGAKIETRWNDVMKGTFIGHFDGAFSQNTHWVEQWTPGRPFNNLFMLRNISIKWSSMMDYDSNGKEYRVRENMEAYRDELRRAFLEAELVTKHFSRPDTAFDEVMKFNDGGIEYIKHCLAPLCDPNLKLSQITNSLFIAQEKLYSTLAPFYHSGNQEEEMKKKMALYGAFGKLFANPLFKERFPDLLNNFKISPEQLFYLHGEAERRCDEYRETAFAAPQEEEIKPEAEVDLTDFDPLAIFEEESPQKESKSKLPVDKDVISFYAERIIEAWSSHMHSLAESVESSSYYLFPKTICLAVLDEFDSAIARLDLQGTLEAKFREIASPVDISEESKTRKQASYAISKLNDFVSWMGKNPAEKNASELVVAYRGKEINIFTPNPEPEGFPTLEDTAKPFISQWYKDWLLAFYGMLVDNVAFTDGTKINIEENQVLGRIIEKVKEENK